MFLLIPMLVALILDAGLTYSVALAYANHVHDNDLAEDALTVALMLKSNSNHGDLSPQARFLLEYDPDGRDYFAIRSARDGLIDGSHSLPMPAKPMHPGEAPILSDAKLHDTRLRVASIAIANPSRAGDIITISMGENMRSRRRQARQILLLAVPLQAMLIVVLLLLVRFGVSSGLKVLEPLTRRLAGRERDLTPIEDSDVPVELLPLTRTIDGLFARQRELIALHERFIADAAHQLRTPLAGLALHVDRARTHAQDETLRDALQHIGTLTARVTRTSNQLLALTRAQAPPNPRSRHQPVDLAKLLRQTIEPRLHEAWRSGVDLGYEGPEEAAPIPGNSAQLQEMVDNLIDNALRYAGRDGSVTVGLEVDVEGRSCISVEDNGPGVDAEMLPRLGERFFRDPDSNGTGTGLGLAIVGHIAERHNARVVYRRSSKHGLRVEIHFPPLESKA